MCCQNLTAWHPDSLVVFVRLPRFCSTVAPWAIAPSATRLWPKPYVCVLIDAPVHGSTSFPHVHLLTFTWPIRCAMNLYVVPLNGSECSCQAALHSALRLPSIKIHRFHARLANGVFYYPFVLRRRDSRGFTCCLGKQMAFDLLPMADPWPLITKRSSFL